MTATTIISAFIGILALGACLVYRARWPWLTDSAASLSDEMVRQIEEAGYVDVDEPLDLEQIQDEEARFWDEAPWEDEVD
jgi:hypothetical protein